MIKYQYLIKIYHELLNRDMRICSGSGVINLEGQKIDLMRREVSDEPKKNPAAYNF